LTAPGRAAFLPGAQMFGYFIEAGRNADWPF